MNNSFVPVTQLQRNTKNVLASEEPFQIILNNNQTGGMIVNEKATEFMINSGILDEIREELYELNDAETCQVIEDHRRGKSKPISFSHFRKKHGV